MSCLDDYFFIRNLEFKLGLLNTFAMSEKYKYQCKISGKRIFESHSEAKEIMIAFNNRIRTKYQGKRIKHRQGKPQAKRVYLCPFCSGYHITKAVYYREDQAKIAKKQAEAKEQRFDKLVNRRLLKEHWKPIEFDFELSGHVRLEVSDWGRVRSLNKVSYRRILKGDLSRGYRIIRLKLYKPKDPETQHLFNELKKEISDLERIITKKHLPESIDKRIEKKKKELDEKRVDNLRKRTINHSFLIHALVAKYFLPEPKAEETELTHIDFDKLNNRATNLKWMTSEQNQKHQSGIRP
jgi:hypothetical protein